MYFYHFFIAFIGLSIREIKKFSMQKGRLFSAIVRPALWLFVFAAGVGSACLHGAAWVEVPSMPTAYRNLPDESRHWVGC